MAKEAEKEGFVLDEQSQAEIKRVSDGVTALAENNDLSADQYMAGIYGRDMSLERYEELMTMSFMAESIPCTSRKNPSFRKKS